MAGDGPVDDPPEEDAASSGDTAGDGRTSADAAAGRESSADGSADGCSCKLGRSSRAHGLGGIDETLRRRHADGASLRDLERVVNESLLERALDDARAGIVGDVAGVYETLVGEAGSVGEQTELRRRLGRADVDVAALESDFVSYQTVRTHLRECLGEDTGRDATLSRQDAIGTVEWARSRSEGIVERTLERLASSSEITAGDLDVNQVVRVSCSECGASASVAEFLEGDGCDCES